MTSKNTKSSRVGSFQYGPAICYSGYRQGQNPGSGIFPTYKQVKEDLLILARQWRYIRVYDPNQHAETVLEVIRKEKLDLQVLLGMCLAAEMNNDTCPWGRNLYSEEQLAANRAENLAQVDQLIALAKQYPDLVFAISAGNEATVDWTDHPVPVERIIENVRKIKAAVKQPVTFCENYVPWLGKIKSLADELDIISVHTYPLWESIGIENAMSYTIDNYQSVKNVYPDKPVIITEAGWATKSNGRGIPAPNANEDFQQQYYESLVQWSRENEILTFVFEAFDEDWKGSPDPLEPEKHWGLYTIDRQPKKVMTK